MSVPNIVDLPTCVDASPANLFSISVTLLFCVSEFLGMYKSDANGILHAITLILTTPKTKEETRPIIQTV